MKSIQEIISERKPEALVEIDEFLSKNEDSLEEALLKSHVLEGEEVLEILSQFYEFPYILTISEKDIDPELVKILPISFAKKYRVIPLKRKEDSVVIVFAPPLDLYALDEIKSLVGCEIEPVLALDHVVLNIINRVYERDKEIAEGIEDDTEGITEYDIQEPKDLLDADDESPIIRFVNSLLFQAVKEKASDIHLECFEKEVLVRFRKDGILHEIGP